MAQDSGSLQTLTVALDQAHTAIAGVRDDQLGDPTPCSDWDVGQLVAHLAVGVSLLHEMARGGSPDWSAVPDRVDSAADRFREGADALLAHWREAAVDDSADWQLGELAVHTWDLVTATRQSIDLDPAPAERGLAFMSQALQPEMRGDVFDAEREPPPDADAHERIAAFAGRDVLAAR
jgi:uncharacterized protein (TIGR03086 family)